MPLSSRTEIVDLGGTIGTRGRSSWHWTQGEQAVREVIGSSRGSRINADEAHVWVVPTSVDWMSGSVDDFLIWCSADERLRQQRFVFERDRRSFAIAHGLVRLSLSWCQPVVHPAAWQFWTGPYGRPEVCGPTTDCGLRASLSHCRDWVACVVTHHVECGVDVEGVGRIEDCEGLASRTLTPDEVRELHAVAPDLRGRHFIERWTLKEAYAKAIGLGLHQPFNEVGFAVAGPGIRLVIPGEDRTAEPSPSEQWHFEQWAPDERHTVALAIRNGGGPAQVIRHGAAVPQWLPGDQMSSESGQA